ncbi:MAG: SCO family protein [Thaumarchaeota archaeon]|nr:SCO family protein [Candidatus Calditenuaceae archaeon]
MSPKTKRGLSKMVLLGVLGVSVGIVIAILALTVLPSPLLPGRSGGYEPTIKVTGGKLAPLELTDKYGKKFTLDQVKGKPVLIYFGYTNCPDVCPLVLQKFKKTIEALGRDADKIAFIFVSVDPWRDTPETMREYVDRYFDPRIIALTGTEEQIAKVILDYKVPVFYTDERGNPVDPAKLPPGSRYFANHFTWVLGADRNHQLILALTPEMLDKEYIDASRYLISR